MRVGFTENILDFSPVIADQINQRSDPLALKSEAASEKQLLFQDFTVIIKDKPYVPITGCLFEHLITTSSLSSLEKLFYLLVNSLAVINCQNNRQRSVALPASSLAQTLGCSKSQIFLMQQSLEEKGYFTIAKTKNSAGQNKRNLLTPTLPNAIFTALCAKPNRAGQHLPFDETIESNLLYLDRSKLFIPLNYQLLKIIITSNKLTPLQKLVWLDFYTICYKSHLAATGKFGFSFVASYSELMTRYNCNKAVLSKTINILVEKNFITKQRGLFKHDQQLVTRQDKSLWQISLALPACYILELGDLKNRPNLTISDSQPTTIALESYNKQLNTTNQTDDHQQYLDNVIEELTIEQPTTNKSQYVIPEPILNQANEFKGEAAKAVPIVREHSRVLQNSFASFKMGNGIIPIHRDVSCTDPHIANFSLYKSKYYQLNSINFKSNLELTPNVTLNVFNDKFKKKLLFKRQSAKKESEFNIATILIREKLKTLPKDKADKARKFAYCLYTKKLATGYAASLSKHELAKQLIHHAATWKPKSLGNLSTAEQIDVALAVAWKAVVNGKWQAPVEWVKAEVLQHEYQCYYQKYHQSGILSNEVKSLESAVANLLGSYYNLSGRITSQVVTSQENVASNLSCQNCPKQAPTLATKDDMLVTTRDYYELGGELDKIYPHSVDLSKLTDQEKHLKISGREDEYLSVQTINGQEYIFQLKTIAANDEGDFLMTMKPLTTQAFIPEPILNQASELKGEAVKAVPIVREHSRDLQNSFASFKMGNGIRELPHEYDQLPSLDNSVITNTNFIATATPIAEKLLAKDEATLDKIIQKVMVGIEGKG